MPFPIPDTWNLGTADALRDEKKRESSPSSFFYSQSRTISLAASYFKDDRLCEDARGGVARKHRHRIQLALFGQLMASFEYMLKDFVAKAIDSTSVLDKKLQGLNWINVTPAAVLASRSTSTTPGSLLVHSTLGWHSPPTVNERYQELFERRPIANDEIPKLEILWILRHTVAHNAGYVTHFDSSRVADSGLANKIVNTDDVFIESTAAFLCPIAQRLASQVGVSLLEKWKMTLPHGDPDFARDCLVYRKLKALATMVESRPTELPEFTEHEYLAEYPG